MSQNLKRGIIFLSSLVLIALLGVVFYYSDIQKSPELAVCTTEAKLCPNGSYVSRIAPDCKFAPCPKEDLIKIESPRANEKVGSPLTIRGEARGFWFFEATFPVELYDEADNFIAQSHARAEGEWMTEEFVPFEANLEFNVSVEQRGRLVLRKSNPSGFSEHSDKIAIPIVLTPNLAF